MSPPTWHLVTGEYGHGGIGDYTALLAHALADAGDAVVVWTPEDHAPKHSRVEVRTTGGFGRAELRGIHRQLAAATGPRRLLVQYTPQAFGARGMNTAFCRWVADRRRAGDEVRVMFHEPYYPFGLSVPHRNLLAAVNRWMAVLLLRAATHVYVSTPAWEPRLRRWAPGGRPFTWLPVPSTIPRVHDPVAVSRLRTDLTPDAAPLVAHFGTYGTAVRELIEPELLALLAQREPCRVLLLGRGGHGSADRLGRRSPSARQRIRATGALSAAALSLHMQAADLAIQPYADGISTRRTSAMAWLAHGVPVVGNTGAATEELWDGAVALTPGGRARRPGALAARAAALLDRPDHRSALAAAAQQLYEGRFSIEHTVAVLRGGSRVAAAC